MARRKRRVIRDAEDFGAKALERAKGIEPLYAAWKTAVLPLNYARKTNPGCDAA
jgi:hypothetical protein